MPYYKNVENKLHYLELTTFEHLLPPGCVAITDEEATAISAPTAAEIVASLTAALESHYDSVAQAKRYDNRLTCALRAGYAGPFRAEGQAFAVWMDNCNAYAYQVMADCLAGTRAIPTGKELIAELPVFSWPGGA